MAVPADLNHDGWMDSRGGRRGRRWRHRPPRCREAVAPAAALGTAQSSGCKTSCRRARALSPRTIAEGLNYPVAVHLDRHRPRRPARRAVATRDDGRITWYENNGDGGSFGLRRGRRQPAGRGRPMYTGDFDDDGNRTWWRLPEDSNQIAWLRNGGEQPPTFAARLVRNGPPPPTRPGLCQGGLCRRHRRRRRPGYRLCLRAAEPGRLVREPGRAAAAFRSMCMATDMPHAKSVIAADIDATAIIGYSGGRCRQ